jgi:serine/threonine protein kinase
MNDSVVVPQPHIVIQAEQVHIHLHSSSSVPPQHYRQQQQQQQQQHHHHISMPENERRSLFGRLMGTTAAAQNRSARRPSNIPRFTNMNDTPSAPPGNSTHLIVTNVSGSSRRQQQETAAALSDALTRGGAVTLGQTTIRLNRAESAPDPTNNNTTAQSPATETTRRKRNPRSSELPEHRFWLKGDLREPLLELQRHSFYDAGTIVHHTRLAMLVQESVQHRQTLPLYVGNTLPVQSIVYTEQELRQLFRQVCLAVQVLHVPGRFTSSSDSRDHGYVTFPTAHRNLHLNHILVDPTTGQVSLRGFQHAVRLDQTVDPSSFQQTDSSNSGGGQEEQKLESFISTVTDTFGEHEHERSSATSGLYYSTAPLIFDEPDDDHQPTSDADPETLARRHRRRLKRRTYDWFAFRAPELHVDGAPHGTAVDIWSLGAALYVLLTGLPPFRGTGTSLSEAKLAARIAPYDITTEPSAAAQDLVQRMLVVDPRQRLDIGAVLAHEWLADESESAVAASMSSDLTLAQACLQDWGRRSKK